MFCVANENNTENREEIIILLHTFGLEPNLYSRVIFKLLSD